MRAGRPGCLCAVREGWEGARSHWLDSFNLWLDTLLEPLSLNRSLFYWNKQTKNTMHLRAQCMEGA